MRILITGGRDWSDVDAIRDAIMLATIGVQKRQVFVVHGAARGADSIADQIARGLGMIPEPHPANWSEHHRAAGPIRNQAMVDLGADVCLAFLQAGSKGTKDCIKRANAAGIPTIIYPEDEEARYQAEQLFLETNDN